MQWAEPWVSHSHMPKGHLTMNPKIKHEMQTLSSLVVKEKLRVSAEMLKATFALSRERHRAKQRDKPEGEIEERVQDVLGMGHWGKWEKMEENMAEKHKWVLPKSKSDLINSLVEKDNEICV